MGRSEANRSLCGVNSAPCHIFKCSLKTYEKLTTILNTHILSIFLNSAINSFIVDHLISLMLLVNHEDLILALNDISEIILYTPPSETINLKRPPRAMYIFKTIQKLPAFPD